jgi:hypothetical protein
LAVGRFSKRIAQIWGRLRVPHAENPLDKQIAGRPFDFHFNRGHGIDLPYDFFLSSEHGRYIVGGLADAHASDNTI